MTRVTAALAVLVVAAYAPGSPAQEDDLASAAPPERRLPSDWSFEFGGGALALPSYAGAASTKVIPLPWVDLHYRDRFFLSPISVFLGFPSGPCAPTSPSIGGTLGQWTTRWQRKC